MFCQTLWQRWSRLISRLVTFTKPVREPVDILGWGIGYQPSQNAFGEQVRRKVETGFNAKGTQASAQRTQASRGLRACSPWEFFKFRHSHMQFIAIWGI